MGQDPKKRDKVEEQASGLAEPKPDGREVEPQPPVTAIGAPGSSDGGRLECGTVLANRYRIVRLVGSGGIGEVYRADDLILGETVALKVLATDPGRGSQKLKQLLDEVRLARKVGHPNVCRVHDIGEAQGLFFISMEYIDGEDLASNIRRSGPLSSDRALLIGIQIAEGLAAIHAQGVLHLDLKPANLMIDPVSGVKITDFGLAGRIGEVARGGTPVYMAPEQLEGSACEASDLYALGLVLYELVTGRRPFSGPIVVVAFRHRGVVPTPPSAIVENVDPRIERLILSCLEKDPARRPASAMAVAEALMSTREPVEQHFPEDVDLTGPAPADDNPRSSLTSDHLRRWPPSQLPDRPYPVLLPYTHPQLFAGRRRELGELQRMLRLQAPILGLYAASGTGKSSLLMGGLVPWLKASGWPVAYTRYPWEPCLAERLLGDLFVNWPSHLAALAADGGGNIDWKVFGDAMADVTRVAKDTPVVILDQAEELLIRSDARPARAFAGALLAATAQRRPGLAGPPCRWLLAYRQEYHGDIVAWLADVLADARAEGLGPLDGLPHSLDGADRFLAVNLEPLGAPSPGADPLDEASTAFRAAIEAPLRLTSPDGSPAYPLRFAPGHIERLAVAFGRTRLVRPEAPLVPELQVVLAHLQATAGEGELIEVPDDVDGLIGEALEDHLWRALEAAFPAGRRGAEQARARALLALRELAHATGRRVEGLPTAALAMAIGEGGEQILERLAAPDTRLVVAWEHPDGLRWVLSHDRLAEAVVRLVESEGQHGRLLVDVELLALRRFVSLESALFGLRGEAPDRVGRRRSRQIENNRNALLFDDSTRRWWAACRAKQRVERWRMTALVALVTMVLGIVATGTWRWTAGRAELRGLYEQVAEGEPEASFAAVDELLRRSDVAAEDVCRQLEQRASPLDILERGLGGVPDEARAEAVVRAAPVALLLIDAAPDEPVLLASLMWALDAGPARDEATYDEVQDLRSQIREALWQHRAPPQTGAGSQWTAIAGGTFLMGSDPGEGRDEGNMMDERPRHRVTVSPFQLLTHEVTNAEYRRLVPDHEGQDDLPIRVTWYEAYRYAVWLGGRLPTEAEWEYAARAGCSHEWCGRDGAEVTVEEVAWLIDNATDPVTSQPALRGGMQLEPNPWGLYDMFGNCEEWTADWYGRYSAEPQQDPVGESDSDYRVFRGGNVTMDARWVQSTGRGGSAPVDLAGVRVLLPTR